MTPDYTFTPLNWTDLQPDWADLVEENGLLENLQAGAYMIAFLLLLSVLWRVRGFNRILTSVFALTMLTFFLREVDVEFLAVPHLVKQIGSGIWRNLLLGIGYFALFVICFLSYRVYYSTLVTVARSRVASWVFAGCMFLLVGSIFEETGLVFAEEILELMGASLILTAAVAHAMDPTGLSGRRLVTTGHRRSGETQIGATLDQGPVPSLIPINSTEEENISCQA